MRSIHLVCLRLVPTLVVGSARLDITRLPELRPAQPVDQENTALRDLQQRLHATLAISVPIHPREPSALQGVSVLQGLHQLQHAAPAPTVPLDLPKQVHALKDSIAPPHPLRLHVRLDSIALRDPHRITCAVQDRTVQQPFQLLPAVLEITAQRDPLHRLYALLEISALLARLSRPRARLDFIVLLMPEINMRVLKELIVLRALPARKHVLSDPIVLPQHLKLIVLKGATVLLEVPALRLAPPGLSPTLPQCQPAWTAPS